MSHPLLRSSWKSLLRPATVSPPEAGHPGSMGHASRAQLSFSSASPRQEKSLHGAGFPERLLLGLGGEEERPQRGLSDTQAPGASTRGKAGTLRKPEPKATRTWARIGLLVNWVRIFCFFQESCKRFNSV